MGTSTLRRISEQRTEGVVTVDIDQWRLTLRCDSDGLDYCEACQAPDGRSGTVADWQRYGSDPLQWLSIWERAQLERLLEGQRR